MDHKNSVRRDASAWDRLMMEYEETDMSKSKFCKLHKINRGYFYKKHREYRSRKPSMKSANEFIPLKVITPSSAPNCLKIGSELEIENGSGIKLKFIKGCEVEELREVMRVISDAR